MGTSANGLLRMDFFEDPPQGKTNKQAPEDSEQAFAFFSI